MGLHHLALRVGSPEDLHKLHARLQTSDGVEIEAAPQPFGTTTRQHMMCREPGGIRIEFVTSPSA